MCRPRCAAREGSRVQPNHLVSARCHTVGEPDDLCRDPADHNRRCSVALLAAGLFRRRARSSVSRSLVLFFLILPLIFFSGLVLIPVGIVLRRGKFRRRGGYPDEFPPVNWANPAFRQLSIFVALATTANVVIGGHYTYSAVDYMDSVSFCGESCHVMTPEFTAYKMSPHAQVACVDCHVGEGPASFVLAKLNGVSQLVGVATGSHSRPIPTPVHNLRPANETCGKCHSAGHRFGDRLRVIKKFEADESNTPSFTALLIHVGGGAEESGIHGAHLAPGRSIEYLSDASRETIPWVFTTDSSGKTTVFTAEDWKPEEAESLVKRTMDCTDCHNRPAHTFQLPGRALNQALARGRIDSDLPMISGQGLKILKAEYGSRQQAAAGIPEALEKFYGGQYPGVSKTEFAAIRDAGAALAAIYQGNVFPEMNVTWGTYPNQIGHTDHPGCFRCHDDLHATKDGTTISQDCSVCHELLALEEESPEVLGVLGIR